LDPATSFTCFLLLKITLFNTVKCKVVSLDLGHCRCQHGWTGVNCDQCVTKPGCHHGYCVEPWQCICHQRWTGIYCNHGTLTHTPQSRAQNSVNSWGSAALATTKEAVPLWRTSFLHRRRGPSKEAALSVCTSSVCLSVPEWESRIESLNLIG